MCESVEFKLSNTFATKLKSHLKVVAISKMFAARKALGHSHLLDR